MAIKALSQRIPTLRLYQQIILYVIVVIFIPLLGVHGLIYNINQKALKKELVKFTEHTAEIIYTDVTAQMAGQAEQVRLLASLIKEPLEKGTPIDEVTGRVFQASPQTMRISLYDAQGKLLANVDNITMAKRAQVYAINPPPDTITPQQLPPSQQSQASLGMTGITGASTGTTSRDKQQPVHFDIAYQARIQNALTAPTEEAVSPDSEAMPSPYILTSTLKLPTNRLIKIEGQWVTPAFYRFEKTFPYLDVLIKRQNRKLSEGFYLIDTQGQMLAGPTTLMNTPTPHELDERKTIGQQLTTMSPGRTNVVSEFKRPFWHQTVESLEPLMDIARQPIEWIFGKSEQSDEDTTPIEKVVMKLPGIDWGIIIESPYSVRQKYVKRARNQTLLIIFLQLLVAILVTVFYITNLRRNFRQLIKGIQAVAEGRYSRRIRLIANWLTPFELMYLTSEFNRMSRRRAEAWDESEALNKQLTDANTKLAQLDDMKSNLIDTVSHELRTPLTSIKGYTSRLIRYDDTLDKDMRLKSLKVIKRQADRLNRLVDDLLVIPELEQQHLRVAVEPVNLRSLLTRSVQSVAEKERDQLPEININYPEGVEPKELSVVADEDRLEQVLINLLDNAVKYAEPDTPITVAITQSSTKASSEEIAIAVQNTCPPDGIPENTDAARQLFEKFKRLDESTTRTTRGTGLGLYITKGLVEAMHGTIDVNVDGTEFTITVSLPAAAAVVA